MAEHTPGPLAVITGHEGDAYGVQAPNGEIVAVMCMVYKAGTPEGNAQLFAAAPDLLEAARLALLELEQLHSHYLPTCEGGCPTREAIAKLDAAIDKAEGRTPEAKRRAAVEYDNACQDLLDEDDPYC